MPRTVVCFGDSNTYGTPAMPTPDAWARFGPQVRWPGILAKALGEDWTVIEEGLPGRTTVHDDPIEGVDKNGLKALAIVLGSHRPIDRLVIMLGCNDLKARFSVTSEDIAASAGVLVRAALSSPAGLDGGPPTVLVVAPPPITETGFLGGMFRGGAAKSARLGQCFSAMAARMGVECLDAGALVVSDPVDGIHMTAGQHAILGRAVADRLLG